MSIYFEKARELGNLILESEQAKMLADATNIYQNDADAQAKMMEYNKYQENVKTNMSAGTFSKEEITIATRRLTEMATELKQDPIIGALVFSENEFNGFVNQVMSILKSTIMGDENKVNECSSNGCSSCSGCN